MYFMPQRFHLFAVRMIHFYWVFNSLSSLIKWIAILYFPHKTSDAEVSKQNNVCLKLTDMWGIDSAKPAYQEHVRVMWAVLSPIYKWHGLCPGAFPYTYICRSPWLMRLVKSSLYRYLTDWYPDVWCQKDLLCESHRDLNSDILNNLNGKFRLWLLVSYELKSCYMCWRGKSGQCTEKVPVTIVVCGTSLEINKALCLQAIWSI